MTLLAVEDCLAKRAKADHMPLSSDADDRKRTRLLRLSIQWQKRSLVRPGLKPFDPLRRAWSIREYSLKYILDLDCVSEGLESDLLIDSKTHGECLAEVQSCYLVATRSISLLYDAPCCGLEKWRTPSSTRANVHIGGAAQCDPSGEIYFAPS